MDEQKLDLLARMCSVHNDRIKNLWDAIENLSKQIEIVNSSIRALEEKVKKVDHE